MNAKTILRLVFASLAVGFVLHSLDITPKDFWVGALDSLRWAWDNAMDFFSWGLIYIVTGAFIVVPIFIVNKIMNARKIKSRGPNKDI